jgi:hypothetical protein
MERYSSAIESKSSKDYLEMTRHWFDNKPEPEVFADAQNWIGAPGFRVRSSASFASAVYSGVFCLLALRNARDWRRGEDIRLQDLQDHHVFPRAYLKRYGITKRVDVNSITNRALISDQTNGIIKDKALAIMVGPCSMAARRRHKHGFRLPAASSFSTDGSGSNPACHRCSRFREPSRRSFA